MDGDGQHDPSYIPEFIKALRTAEADVVIGSRFLAKNKLSPIPKYRIVGMKVFPITVRYNIENTSSKNPVSHGVGVLGWLISTISESRPLFFFGVAGATITIIGLIFGANVLYVANAGRGVAVGSALV